MLMIRPAREDDVKALVPRLRSIDKLECAMFAQMGPREALKDSLTSSMWARTALIEGQVQCIFGVTPQTLLGPVGRPWMLGAEGIERHARHIVRYSRGYVEAMLGDFRRLENFIHADNSVAIRWLKWCGFTFEDCPPFAGEPIKMFWREAA